MAQGLFEFIWMPTFERTSRKLLTDEDWRAIEGMLCEDVHSGSVMKRTGGFRKLRYALASGGKRGGARIVYFADEIRGRVFMILAYAKSAKKMLTRDEERELRRIAVELKGDT